MRQAFIQGLLKRVRAQWRCQNIKRVSFSFLSSCLYHTHTCFLPFSLHSSFYLSIFPSLIIERTESSLSPPPPHCLQIDWDASPEQKKQCLNKGRDNQVHVCSSSLSYCYSYYYYYYPATFSFWEALWRLYLFVELLPGNMMKHFWRHLKWIILLIDP